MSVAPLIITDELSKYTLSDAIMMYNVCFRGRVIEYDQNKTSVLSTDHVVAKRTNIYKLAPDTYGDNLNNLLCAIKTQLQQEDFGLTIILFYLAEYYSNNQYPIFIMFVQSLPEMNVLVQFITSSKFRYFEKLLSINKTYGLYANRDKFINTDCITLESFCEIMDHFLTGREPSLSYEAFIEKLVTFHRRVIESMYLIVTVKIKQPQLMTYDFQKPIDVSQLYSHAVAWFQLPTSVCWFAYNGYSVKCSSSNILTEMVFNKFNRMLEGICIENKHNTIVGYIITNNDGFEIVPLYFEHLVGQWTLCTEIFAKYHITTRLISMQASPPTRDFLTKKTIYFVAENDFRIYKVTAASSKRLYAELDAEKVSKTKPKKSKDGLKQSTLDGFDIFI